MASGYALTWLFTAETADGQIFRQTPADMSSRFPAICLTPVADEETLIVLRPGEPGYAGTAAAIAAGETVVAWEGRDCFWQRRSARADLLDYEARGEIVQFTLTHTAAPERQVTVVLGCQRARERGLTPGDMLIGMPGLAAPVRVPFALPDRLWQRPWPATAEVARDLRLVYGRDLTWQGFPPEACLTEVVYRIGWQVDLHGRCFEHALHLQGEL